MKKLSAVIIILFTGIISVNGQCTCNYNFSGANDTLTFTNLSSVSNAHYYWNFGDGSGSNEINPIHIFPDDGKYLVTLYGLDTVSNCSSVYESWISVIKPDTISCNVFFTDTVIAGDFQSTDLSTNCSGYNLNCQVIGPSQNYCGGGPGGNWGSSLFLHGMQASSSDSINGFRIMKEYYKTLPYYFTSANNYQDCSANFEVIIDYQANGAMVTFTAMNKNATSYNFYITGFGNPIILNGQTVSYLFPYYSYRKTSPSNIYLITNDSINNCSDTIVQQILVVNPYYSFPISCAISLQPQNQTIYVGSTVQFIISSLDGTQKQWQQDAGLGYVNLTDAGPYSGVHTDTLTISNVQLTMNNYHYKCRVTGNCHNTSSEAILTVPAGINELSENNIKIFPNPVTDILSLTISDNSKDAEYKIFNIQGENKISERIKEENTNIDISPLSAGIYFIEVTLADKIYHKKFIKQ